MCELWEPLSVAEWLGGDQGLSYPHLSHQCAALPNCVVHLLGTCGGEGVGSGGSSTMDRLPVAAAEGEVHMYVCMYVHA